MFRRRQLYRDALSLCCAALVWVGCGDADEVTGGEDGAPTQAAVAEPETTGTPTVVEADADAQAPEPAGESEPAPGPPPTPEVKEPTAAERKAWPPTTTAVKRLPDLKPFSYFQAPDLGKASKLFHKGANLEAAAAFETFANAAHGDDPRKLPARMMALLARHDGGDCKETVTARLEAFADEWPLMAHYARFFAASCHVKAKRYDKATQLLTEHAAEWGVLRGRAGLLALDAAEATKTSAIPLLRKLRVMDQPVNRMDIYNRMLAKADTAKNADRSKSLRLLLVEHFTDTRSGRKALKGLGGPKKLTPGENLRVGRALFEHHFHRDALKHLKVAADKHPRFSEPRCQALMMLGRTHDKMKRRTVAWRYHRRALGCKDEALYWATFAGGKNRFKAGQFVDARRILERHIKTFPKRTTTDDAALMIALSHRDAGNEAEAQKVLRMMLKTWPNGDKADEAAWQLLWPLIQKRRWKKAEAVAAELVGSMQRESHFRAEGRVRYWYARILQQRAKVDKANAQYRKVLEQHPLSWYAVLAYSRLHAQSPKRALKFAQDTAAKALAEGKAPDLLEAGKAWFDKHPAFHRAVELLRMGLERTARRELARIGRKGTDASVWTRAWVLSAAGAHTPATTIARREEPNFGAWWPTPGSPAVALWKLAHPRPFSKSVKRWAKVRKIDPYWIWSIMREESNFNAGAVSWANAYGAMQIILPTAKTLARKEGIAISRRKLFNPDTSVRLGSRYLAGLLNKFGRIPLASPGYNAGGGAVAGWKKSDMGRLELDEFVERIPYDEARGYAIRVTRSLARYHWLYRRQMLHLDLSPPRPKKVRGRKGKKTGKKRR